MTDLKEAVAREIHQGFLKSKEPHEIAATILALLCPKAGDDVVERAKLFQDIISELKRARNELAALLVDPLATEPSWPVENPADGECLTAAYNAVRGVILITEDYEHEASLLRAPEAAEWQPILKRLVEHCDNMEAQHEDYHIQAENGVPCRSRILNEAIEFLSAPSAPSVDSGVSEENQRLKAKLAALADRLVYSDSYGVHGSDFKCCMACQGGGIPNVPFEHDKDCPVIACEEVAEQWLAEQKGEREDYEAEIAELKSRVAALPVADARNEALEEARRIAKGAWLEAPFSEPADATVSCELCEYISDKIEALKSPPAEGGK